jgi:ABC-type polysaccharide/polyol phosphate transport system ATPase subunit
MAVSDDIFRLDGVSVAFRRRAVGEPSLKRALSGLWRRRRSAAPCLALRGVSLRIRKGERVGVVGRNGAGKSTLLRVLARVVTPQAGSVHTAPACRVVPLLELGLGFHPDLSGLENCRLAGTLLGHDPAEIRRRLPRIVAFAEIDGYVHEPVKCYSSGMSARLAFALATDVEPGALLVDEVLGVGDEFFTRKCLDRMRQLVAAGTAAVLVSHDLPFLSAQCDRLIWLDRGRVVMDGAPANVAAAYRALRGAL